MPLGTANGVLYLNGSKVVTSGSGLTFDGTTFVLPSGNVSIGASASGRVLEIFNGDAVNLQRLRLTTSGTDGVIQVTRNSGTVPNLIFQQDASELMRLTSTGLGIGTSSPRSQLMVLGTGQFVSGISDSGNQGGSLTLAQNSGNSGSGGALLFAALNDNNTYVPQWAIKSLLENGSSNGRGSLAFSRRAAATDTSLTEAMRLDFSGNLGLGVTPSAWSSLIRAMQFGARGNLQSSTGTVVLGYNSLYDTGGTFRYVATDYALEYRLNSASGTHAWFTAPSGTAGNAISFTQAMTLDASGNLALGTTSASDKLHVEGSISTYIRAQSSNNSTRGGFKAFGKTAGGANVQVDFVAYGDAPEGGVNVATNHRLTFGTNNTERASIPAAGGMVVGTAALATNATDGFLYVPTCAGTPTGTPTTQTGTAPIVINTTNNKLYFYSGGAWRDAGP
jgi:hypothetical protein